MADVTGLKRVVRPIFGLVAAGFILYAVSDLWRRWDGASVDVQLGYFAAAVIAAGVAMYVQFVAWRVLIRTLTGREMPWAPSARLYLDSQMARYTPGKVGLAVVRIGGAQEVDISPKVMGSALLVEVVSWSATGSLVGATVLALLPRSSQVTAVLSYASWIVALGAFLGLLLALLVDRGRYPEKVRSLIFSDGSGPLVPWSLPLYHLAHFLVWMVAGSLICVSVGGDWIESLMAGGLLCLAIVAGFLAFLAPAGAGVREAVMAAGLAPSLGASTSLAVGILARVASLASDVALWLWFRFRATRSIREV